mmetsp:Transcript_938/g.1345  ORF Transcript_938/g.1345 Transcript_938/m.1345 type:complete len:97 (-) Transcript_938:1098-1388(-)
MITITMFLVSSPHTYGTSKSLEVQNFRHCILLSMKQMLKTTMPNTKMTANKIENFFFAIIKLKVYLKVHILSPCVLSQICCNSTMRSVSFFTKKNS